MAAAAWYSPVYHSVQAQYSTLVDNQPGLTVAATPACRTCAPSA